ncbi:MAG: hypothetical protein NTW05_02550 [Pseudonocardiales bacterium]|jgi:hypothetical protein|nr:hypothetical protein [Pseudonocardiales bacterium]
MAGNGAAERFVVEIRPTEDGRVVGTVGRPGTDDVVTFSGWMDLLRLLEPRSPDAVTR